MNKKIFFLALFMSVSTSVLARRDDEPKRVYRPTYSLIRFAALAGIVAAVLVKPEAVKEAYRDGFNLIASKDFLGKSKTRISTFLTEQKFNKNSPISLDNVIRIACGFFAYEVTQKVFKEIFE